jgi:hypothetical protein
MNWTGQALIEPITRAETTMLVVDPESNVVWQQVLDLQGSPETQRHARIQPESKVSYMHLNQKEVELTSRTGPSHRN